MVDWKKNKSKIMKLVAAHREQRLARERAHRQSNRRYRLQSHCRGILAQCIGNGASLFREQEATCPSLEEFFALPQVAALNDEDTNDVSQEAWDDIAEEIKEMVISRREGILRRLTEILKGEELDPAPESYDDRIAATTTMAKELLQASSAFWCSCCNSVKWYPDVLKHTNNFENLLTRLPESCAGLVDTLITEMKSAMATGEDGEGRREIDTVMDLMILDQLGARSRCLRCDDRVVTYRTFSDLVSHFSSSHLSFDSTPTRFAITFKNACG